MYLAGSPRHLYRKLHIIHAAYVTLSATFCQPTANETWDGSIIERRSGYFLILDMSR